ncbi:MAG: hypothetical protein MHPSP_000951 [Paramarteilia canceri]
MITSIVIQPGLYFSPDFDLNQFCGQETKAGSQKLDRSLFYINHHLKSNFICLDTVDPSFFVDVIQGYYCQFNTSINSKNIELEIIARRYQANNGRRYFNRGVDSLGNTANFVEVNLSMTFDKNIYSFVIVRGTIPIHFTQNPVLFGTAKLIAERDFTSNVEDILKHLKILKSEYGEKVTLINLISPEYKDVLVYDAYERAMNRVKIIDSNIKFVDFDFHKICKNSQFKNIAILMDQLEPIIEDNRFTLTDSKGNNSFFQTGVLRVNCVDSLDRTGVIVSAVINTMLQKWLTTIGVLNENQNFPSWFESKLNNSIFLDLSILSF